MENKNDSKGNEHEKEPLVMPAGTSSQPNPPPDSSQNNSGQPRQDSADESHSRLGFDEESVKIRFGPLSGINDSGNIPTLKSKAWEHLQRKLSMGDGDILQKCSDAITNFQLAGNDLREMMIRDGCFFLQLALLILGCHKELGYLPDHLTFGRNYMEKSKKTCIENMFTVGNQIPLAVLQKFMDEIFKDIVKAKPNWTLTPSRLSEKALYELVVLPVLKNVQNNQPAQDILRGLQILLIGEQNHPLEEDLDLEANEDGYNNASTNGTASIDVSATNLERSGIYIKKLQSEGIGSIDFHNCWLRTYVYLPTFPLDDDTEIILQNLIMHEKQSFIHHQQREVSSYIKFMSDIVRTKKDAKLLADSKIILGNSGYVEKLPGILKRLVASASSSDDHIVLTPQLQAVIRRIRDHSPIGTRLKRAIDVIVILTVFQAVLALVQYIHPLR